MVIVGFTGSRDYMLNSQKWRLRDVLETLRTVSSELRHGGCIGADEVCHGLAKQLGYRVEVHPSDLPGYQGVRLKADVVHDPKPALARNKDIVDACTVLVAVPSGDEIIRSGTWSTVRYARKRGKPVILITPFDGLRTEIR